MRCSFRSTTALAAALALMAPAALLAETPLPPKAAAAMDAASRADMPKRAATLDAELAKGLGPDGLACIGDAPRPCPDGEALVTPTGLAVHLSRDGAIVLAPRKEQRAAAQAAQVAQQGEGAAEGKAAQAADAAAQAAPAEAPAVAAAGGDTAAERRKAERDRAKAEKEEAKAQARAERQAAKAARQSGEAEAVPAADALAASLAQAEAGADAPLVMAQAEAPAAEPVVIPEPAPAEPAAVEPTAPVEEPVPVVEAADPLPPAEPSAAEPPAAEPALVAEQSEPLPAAEPVAIPVVEDPAARAERSEPLPEPQPDPAVAEPPLLTEPAKPQRKPVVGEPAPVSGRAESIPGPQAAPEPVVAQPQQAAPPEVGDAGTPDAAALAAALAGGNAPVVAPAETAAAATAGATGQQVAPTPIEVDEAVTRSLEEALQKAAGARAPAAGSQQRANAAGTAPKPVAAGATGANAAAAAAAAGSPPVAEALDAPATIADDATAVVVTEGSARSASEDFATRLTEGLTQEQLRRFQQMQQQRATQGEGGQPVVMDGGGEASRDDDDNTERDLARMLLAGVGGYALANILANNGQIALSTPDRVVVEQPDGTQTVIKDDNALLLQPGAQVTTENFADGSSRSIVTREDGSRVVTIRDANLRVLRRTLIAADGTVTELIDDAAAVDPVVVADLPPPARPVEMSGPVSEDALRAALAREAAVDRSFTLAQIRNIPEVRGLVSPVEISAITFDTGSAAIRPDQAQQLATLGKVISDYVRANPGEVFLIEGHTDTVGSAAMNLALSDRRAESVALALAQYFQVPPENMVVQGYGEQYLKVNEEGDVRANRRASVRRITDLLARS